MRNRVSLIAIATVLIAAATMLGTAAAQKASVPKPQDKLALGEESVKQLLPLMDADKNGRVSRQAYMKYMEQEFDRLDPSRTGELNVRQLTQSSVTASHFVGK